MYSSDDDPVDDETSLREWFERNRRDSSNEEEYAAKLLLWAKHKKSSYEAKMQHAQDEAYREDYERRQATFSRQISNNVINNLRYLYSIVEQVTEDLRAIIHTALYDRWDIIDGRDYAQISDDLTQCCKKHLKAYNCFSACWAGGWHFVYDYSVLKTDIELYIQGLAAPDQMLHAAPTPSNDI